MSAKLSEEQLSSYRDAFDMFDVDSSGTISANELASVMRSLGQNPTDAEISCILNRIDIDRSGTIDFEEFVSLMSPPAREAGAGAVSEEDAELLEAFKVFDKDGSGTISHTELAQVMKSLGETLTEEELNRMISEADQNGDNEIDFSDDES